MKNKKPNLALLYENAWNDIVRNLPDWKKKIIINNWPYDNKGDARIAAEIAHKAAAAAEAKNENPEDETIN